MIDNNLSKIWKVIEMAIVIILGSIQDEKTFSTLSFKK
jgi:hypothetical protein